MILGLDVSTSITGITVLSSDGSLELMDFVELSKVKGTIWDKVDKLKEELEKLVERYDITHIFIEEPLSKFSKRRSSSHTISLLMRFNGIISYILYNMTGIDPEYIAPTAARKLCGLKMMNKTACKKAKIVWKPQKEQAFDQMSLNEAFEGYEWPLKRTGRLKDYCYDMMDSFIISRAGFIQLNK